MQTRTLHRLAELNQCLLETASATDAMRLLAQSALPLFRGDHLSLRLCESDGNLRPAARAGVGQDSPAPAFCVGQGVIGWVAENGRVARIDDIHREPRFDPREERGYRVGSLLCAPVTHAGRVRGVLSVSAPRPSAFAPADEPLVRLLASSAAQVLRSAELTQLAIMDSQTHAYNRRCLLPRLHEEMERALRQTQPLSLLLIDLDHFKRVNDRHGHAAGDAVLRSCADRVRECVRIGDVLVRRGGEEFVLIMPATDAAQACRVAERVRRRLSDELLRMPNGAELTQTASIGVATWDGCESAEALEERADHAMYAAKRRGRNRVARAQPPGVPRALVTRATRRPVAPGSRG